MTMLAADPGVLDFLGKLSAQQSGLNSKQSARMRKVQRGLNAQLEASYDAAARTEFNSRYWQAADSLSADEANSPEIRETLRSRARYHCHESDAVLQGIVHTLANDIIGTGPRLQMLIPEQNDLNRKIERKFHSWMRRTQMARKLRMMELAEIVDGESFGQKITNPRLNRRSLRGVTLDLSIIEADQVTTPYLPFDPYKVDGIDFDLYGNPITYHRLDHHPGGPHNTDQTKPISADDMIHAYRQDRAGQHRGVPQVTTALPLAALLRDYKLAVLHNARSSAKFTGVLETGAVTTTEEGDTHDPTVEEFDIVDIDHDMLTSLPFGWHLKHPKQ